MHLQKAGGKTDFSYVPGHSENFKIYHFAQKWINIENQSKKSATGRNKFHFLFRPNPFVSLRFSAVTNKQGV